MSTIYNVNNKMCLIIFKIKGDKIDHSGLFSSAIVLRKFPTVYERKKKIT